MSEQPIQKSSPEYITSVDAARMYRVTHDYIARLCRKGKLVGKLDRRIWMVEAGSLYTFFKSKRELVEVPPQALETVVVESPYIPNIGAAVIEEVFDTNPDTRAVSVKKQISFLPIAGVLLGIMLLAGSAFALVGSTIWGNRSAAAVAVTLSPFFGNPFDIFSKIVSIFSNTSTNDLSQKSSDLPPASKPAADQTFVQDHPATPNVPVATTIVQNTYPITEHTIEHTTEVSGLSETTLDQKLSELDNRIRALLYSTISVPNSLPSSGGTTNTIALTQRIDKLDGTVLTGVTVHGISGLTASDIPALDYLTAAGDTTFSTTSANYFADASTTIAKLYAVNTFTALNTFSGGLIVSGGATTTGNAYFVGNVGISTTTPGSILSIGTTNGINFSTATSTFNSTGGINLAAGCFSVNSVCVGGAGTFLALSDTPSSFNANRILYETSSAVTDNSSFTFDGTTFTVPGFTMANGTITYSSATKNVIQNNTASAWTIATSSTATPLLSIDTTTGSELVTIGKRGGSVQIGDSTTPTNLVFGGSSTISGSGLYTLTFGTTGDVIQYGVGIKPSTTNVFNLGASGSNWGCLYYNNSTLGTCASDERLKTGITDLSFDTATSSALDQLTGLRLRSFAYKSAPTSIYDGLIAQEVLSVAPGLVVEDASTTMLAVKYGDIQWLTIAALQQLNAKFNALLESASSTDQTTDTPPFFSRFLGWFASATNGIGDFFANRVRTRELCVTKADGTDTCVSGDQLAAVLAGQSSSPVSVPAGSAVSVGSASPVITVLGLNPAHIAVGSSYSDLGAAVTDNEDTNLGYLMSLNGGATMTPDQFALDTSVAGTHTITYTAADTQGNVGTATRTVIIEEPAAQASLPQSGNADTGTTTPQV